MIRVVLSRYTGETFIAQIEGHEDGTTIDLAVGTMASNTCRLSAKVLRELADRFDKLAYEEHPTKASTHIRINSEILMKERQ